MIRIVALLLTVAVALSAATAQAEEQGTQVAFGATKADPTLPVEVTSDTLDVHQENGTAEFIGTVRVKQGEMRLSADRVLVFYAEEASAIERMEATGDVVLVNGPDAAEGERADYTIDDGVIVITGDVLLTQGPNAITSEKATINLITGTANMIGRVKTILLPNKSE